MITRFKKSKKRKEVFQTIFLSTLFGILIFGTIAYLVVSNLNIRQKRAELITQIEEIQKDIDDLEQKNQELETGINKTESQDYQREKLYEQGYVEKGEQQVVVLLQEENKETNKEEQKGLWQKLLNKIGF
ncbi:hypothetical protein KAU40_02320 [Candidatus Parcubacteria bacterium]|nr:hypothetical protein [Candidatus Parcubacteria bacterium]